MHRFLMAAGVAAAAAALSACSTLTGGSNAVDMLKQLDANYAHCERHITYQAGIGLAPSAAVSGSVNCPARPTPEATPAS